MNLLQTMMVLFFLSFVVHAQDLRWQSTSLSDEFPVTCYAVDSSGRHFVGTYGGGLYRSMDGGATWAQINEGLYDYQLTALLAHPSGTLFAGSHCFLYFSTDAGESWKPIYVAGLDCMGNNILRMDQNGSVYIASMGKGVHRSDDAGQTWTDLTTSLSTPNIFTLSVHSSGNLIVGTLNEGMFLSSDGGESWWQRPTGPATCGGLTETASGVLYSVEQGSGEFYRSEDNGFTWQPVQTTGLPVITPLVLFSNPDGGLYLGTMGNGAWRSVDDATTWTPAIEGLDPTISVHSFEVLSDGTIIAGAEQGLFYRSFDKTLRVSDRTNAGTFILHGVFPNPASDEAVASLSLGIQSNVIVRVYDILGRLARRSSEKFFHAGTHALKLETESLNPGMYVLRIQAEGQIVSRPLFIQR